MTAQPRGTKIRRDAGHYGFERALQRHGFDPVAGVDEAGRGACAGPLIAAAVILTSPIAGLTDSKLLAPERRSELADRIQTSAIVAVASLSARECDQLGVHRANIEALRRAIARLPVSAAYVLTDGFAVDGLGVPGLAMWKGDRVSASISAASIVAKVTRDQIMTRLHDEYPAYDFAGHKGYATPAHQGALRLHGPCSQHRYSYANVRQVVR